MDISPQEYIRRIYKLAARLRDDIEELKRNSEECWDALQKELRLKNQRDVNRSTPQCIIDRRNWFMENLRTEIPEVLAAAAEFRLNFCNYVTQALPLGRMVTRRSVTGLYFDIAEGPDWVSGLQEALADIAETIETINHVHPEWNVTTETNPRVIFELCREDEQQQLIRQLQAYSYKKIIQRKPPAKPLAESGLLVVPADRINKATIEALASGAMKEVLEDSLNLLGKSAKFWRGYTFGFGASESSKDKIIGVVGFRNEPEEQLWEFIRRNGALAIKAQYALWARAYAETGAKPGMYISVTISQFCDDIGFARKKRAHTPQSKKAAAALIELLTELELVCVYKPPSGPIQRIRGPIWARGIISEELQGYGDIFENDIARDICVWIPTAFSYAPGPFFANETWRAYNRYIALVGEGLLKLRSDNTDKYAVIVGGYLAILARMNGYRKFRINVRTLLEKTGIFYIDGKRNPGRMRKKLEEALERLCKVRVIKSWEITSTEIDADADNLNAPGTLEKLSEPTRWVQNWLLQTVIVDWPAAIKGREQKLKEMKERHRRKSARKSKRNVPHAS